MSRKVGITQRHVVVSVADHSGWAVLVTACVVRGVPTLVDRRRVELIEPGLPTQPYHHETLTLPAAAAERLVLQVRRSIERCTHTALDRLSADLVPGHVVSGVTLREPTLPQLPSTVADAHRSYHVLCRADGMLYHSAICAAVTRRGWSLTLHPRGDELARAAHALQASVPEVRRFLDDCPRSPKTPWTADHRHAFAAGVAVLSRRSPVRPLRELVATPAASTRPLRRAGDG